MCNPKILIHIEGGIVQRVLCDQPFEAEVIDIDKDLPPSVSQVNEPVTTEEIAKTRNNILIEDLKHRRGLPVTIEGQ